jgi:uncharacterized repeat protein (TIGR03803 family)
MKNKVLRLLACGLLVLSTAALLRADRDADRRNERIPAGHKMHSPLHRAMVPSASPGPTGYTPQQLRHAYGFDQLGATGTGQIIAIVDAYGSPTIQADLNTFCTQFGIPTTTVRVYYPQGTPPVDPGYPGWASETSLDVEWAHAIAPGATIVLVAAKSSLTTDLLPAVDYAVSLGATQVSMSWSGPEYSMETSSDFHFNVPGVTFFSSSGDYGAYISQTSKTLGVGYPTCSPYVVGVGGTTLNLDSSGNITSETAWSYNASTGTGSGGGISLYETAPSYQAGWWSGTKRGVPDVAYDADPNTGVPVYLTGAGWAQYGGTSMSAPQWAALSALANSLRSQSINSAPGIAYSLATANYAGYFHDIISGNNGQYSAGPNYDLVTGLGSPVANQLVPALAGGFSAQVAAPVFFPGAGSYSNASAQNVTIVSATSGATIRYTTDGSTPTETIGTIYSGPVSISANTTLTAIAYEGGLTDSPVTSGNYTFVPQAVAPVFSPAAGLYSSTQAVTISTITGGATIRYTTDGSTPTETIGTLYSGPVSIMGPATLNAIAYETGFIDSPVTNGRYASSSLRIMYNFHAYSYGGIGPAAALVQGSDGNFYGTTQKGGTGSDGTVFKITPAGDVLTTLVSFTGTNGTGPNGLVQGSDGNFYGTTTSGGSSNDGTVFKMTSGGALTTLVSFTGTNGSSPYAALVQGTDGNFYGTTGSGGANNNGTVFKITPGGVLTTLVSFNNTTNGSDPYSGLVQGSTGNFYGTTTSGGSNNAGTVFQMTPVGALTTLVSFNGINGVGPTDLVQGSDGNFYGTTASGGSGHDGIVFKMTSAGALTTLASFNGSNGNEASGLVEDSYGNFYGTTILGGSDNVGTVFKITPAGSLTTFAFFNGANGSLPGAALLYSRNGYFYGTTGSGGNFGGGVIFELNVPQAGMPIFSPAAGTYTSAQMVTISTPTSGASIAYTTDGSTPTEVGGTVTHGTLLSNGGTVSISATTTLNAMAFASGYNDSPLMSGTYTINIPLPAATPTFSPSAGTYTSVQTVTISTTTSGAAIRYTTDGSPPTETHGTLLSNGGSVFVSASVTLNAIAYESGYTDSNVGTANYVINLPPAATPTFSPSAGTYTGTQSVAITSTTSGASLAYTTDGSTPTESGGAVTNGILLSNGGSVSVSANTTLNAIAFASGYNDSTVATANYIINIPQAATPAFSPPGGAYAGTQSVTITSTSSSASIAYTTDGSPPAESGGSVTNGTLLSNGGSVSIGTNTTLNAMAFASGYTDSSVATAAYTISAPIPTTLRIQGSNGERPPTSHK